MNNPAVWQFSLNALHAAIELIVLAAQIALGGALLVLLFVQVTLGIVNVLGSLPLAVAVAHNGVAALLLVALVMLNFAAHSPSAFGR